MLVILQVSLGLSLWGGKKDKFFNYFLHKAYPVAKNCVVPIFKLSYLAGKMVLH